MGQTRPIKRLCLCCRPTRRPPLQALTSALSRNDLHIKTSEQGRPSSSSSSFSAAPRLQDSKGHEKGKKIDSKSGWQRAPPSAAHCQILENKSHVFIASPALDESSGRTVWPEHLLHVKLENKGMRGERRRPTECLRLAVGWGFIIIKSRRQPRIT